VFGTVDDCDVLGPSCAAWGSSLHCANSGAHVFLAPERLTRRKRCAADLSLLVRTSTLEDAIGVLKANASFRVDGHEKGATTLISVASPPVAPLGAAHFSVRVADLAACVEVPDDAE
jgi:hypothetical protein